MTNNNLEITVNNSYSQSLYELAKEENGVEEIETQVSSILKLISESNDFQNLVKDPTNSQDVQSKVINAICEKFKINLLLSKFLIFLVKKRRLFFIKKILKDFLTICSSKRGEIVARLKAAKDLNNNEIENIKKSLKENFGSNLKLDFSHDPSLIGGLIIQVGSVMIDTSIRGKLQKIENNMIEA